MKRTVSPLFILYFLCSFCLSVSAQISTSLDLFLKIESPSEPAVGIYASEVGKHVVQLGDFNGDGIDDWAVLLPKANDPVTGYASRQIYLYLGKNSIQSEAAPDYIFSDSDLDRFTLEIAAAGDVNNDGYSDFMVARVSFDSVTYDPTYFVSLVHGSDNIDNQADLSFFPNPADLPQNFNVLSSAGDVNGDNYDDILIGAPQVIGGADTGHVYLYFGGEEMDTSPDLVFSGVVDPNNGAEQFGFKISAAGDMNKDGYDDFVIGANSTSANLYLGSPQPDYLADLVFDNIPGAGISPLPAAAGDVNNDGYDDLLIGLYLAKKGLIYFGGETVDNTADVTFDGYGVQFGWDVTTAGDMNMDGFDDVAISNNLNGISSLYIFFGGTEMDSLADAVINDPEHGDYFGYSISGGGDLNNDGYDDLIAGAAGNFSTAWSSADDAGHVYFLPGGNAINDSAEIVFSGKRPGGDGFGESIAFIGDMNTDKYPELLIGAGLVLNQIYTVGEAYLYHLGLNANSEPDVIFPAYQLGANYNFGQWVSAAGDVNGDSLPDFLIADEHTTYFYYGREQIETSRDAAIKKANHDVQSLAALGDVNNDGFDDFLVCSGQNGPRSAYLYLGRSGLMTSTEDFEYTAPLTARLGESSCAVGDVNRDGFDDFIVGAPGINSVLFWFGDSSMEKTYDLQLLGEEETEYFGMSVSGGYDINGDGFNDMIVGAFNKAYIYFGGDSVDNVADKIIYNDSPDSQFGSLVKAIPDINDDGFDELVIGGSKGLYFYFGGDSMDSQLDFSFQGIFSDLTAWKSKDEDLTHIAVSSQVLGAVWIYNGDIIINSIKQSVNKIIPQNHLLKQNYPNPFNPITNIEYTVREHPTTSQHVNLSIYNILGQKVATLVNEKQMPGSYKVQWDAGNVVSGIYIYCLEAGDYHEAKKMVLIR